VTSGVPDILAGRDVVGGRYLEATDCRAMRSAATTDGSLATSANASRGPSIRSATVVDQFAVAISTGASLGTHRLAAT
jgi:hypothetical protein